MVFNAVVELMTRTLFFVGYISTGGKQLVGLWGDNNSTFHRAYVRRGQLRVLDGCNAAIVEYMTMLGVAAVVGIFSGSKAFNLPTDENAALYRLGRMLGVQIGVELVVGAFVFALEAKGGMVPLQLQYWKSLTLGELCIQFFYRNRNDRICSGRCSPVSVLLLLHYFFISVRTLNVSSSVNFIGLARHHYNNIII
jgi:hypothetical protein